MENDAAGSDSQVTTTYEYPDGVQPKVYLLYRQGHYNILNPKASILELNAHCLQHMFDWLTFSDLKVLRQMCTRLKIIVDDHIESEYKKGFGTWEVFDENGQPKDLRNFDSSFGKLYKHIFFAKNIPISLEARKSSPF